MARYIKDFQINVDPQNVYSAVNQYLQSEGYDYINYDGENVYKKGTGAFTNPTFFKFSFAGNMVRMETWMKYAFFPGVFVGELGMEGFVGSAVKGPWKKRVKNLEATLGSFAMQAPFYPDSAAQGFSNNVNSNEAQILKTTVGYEETGVLNAGQPACAAPSAPVFCNKCGNQLTENVQFCSVCGQQRPEVAGGFVGSNNMGAFQQPFPQANSFVSNGKPLPPPGTPVSRKEFIDNYAQPSLRKNITSIAILCYVCAGLTFIVSCMLNPYGIIDAVALAGLALGMHLTKSRVCAILILVLSIVELVISVAVAGTVPFWWLIGGVSAVVTFNNIEKQYKAFMQR